MAKHNLVRNYQNKYKKFKKKKKIQPEFLMIYTCEKCSKIGIAFINCHAKQLWICNIEIGKCEAKRTCRET